MAVIQLPFARYYVSVDRVALRAGMSRIEEQFRDLLVNGLQAQGLPQGVYAAGQYLNPNSINQRGLYGTAGALLALGRAAPTSDRIELMEGLIRYISSRPTIEHTLASNDVDRSLLEGRLATEWNTAFKCADLLYAVTASPAAVGGREELTKLLLDRIESKRLEDGGWAADLESDRGHDVLATASIVRALNSAGVAIDSTDRGIVSSAASDEPRVSVYVRMFCLLVLAELGEISAELDAVWTAVVKELKPQLQDRTEANYEFALGNRYSYVRIPWQLYMVSYAAIRNPLAVMLGRDIREVVLGGIQALMSPTGYVYESYGHMKSTRTYSVLMDCLWRVDTSLSSSTFLASLAAVANWSARVLYSRATSGITLAGALVLAIVAASSWVGGVRQPIAQIGPELFASALLAAISFLLRQVRR